MRARHAFNVAHASWELLRRGALVRALPDASASLDALALLLAAVLHDAEHPGRTNAFEIGAGTPRSVRYNGACLARVIGHRTLRTCHRSLHLY